MYVMNLSVSVSTTNCVLSRGVKVHLKEGVLNPFVRDAEVCADVVIFSETHFQGVVISECRPYGAATIYLCEFRVLEGAVNYNTCGVDVDRRLIASSAFVNSRAGGDNL